MSSLGFKSLCNERLGAFIVVYGFLYSKTFRGLNNHKAELNCSVKSLTPEGLI